jgi:hypothetical protein
MSIWTVTYETGTWKVSYTTHNITSSLNEDRITQGDDSLTSYDASISKDVLERPTVEGQAEAAFVTELETDMNGRGISTSFTAMTNWKIPYETTDISSQSDISFLP